MYPENDDQFEDVTIELVSDEGPAGWSIKRSDGWSFFVDREDAPVEPKVGMSARFYGQGIGARVRGLFLDGQKVFYRTEAEDQERHEIELYGADAADWLARWDAGRPVWTIEMGGLGPGYEQAIQVTVAELLRTMLAGCYDHSQWSDKEAWQRDLEAIEKAAYENGIISQLGLSGAQFVAAMNVATHLFMHGPRKVMTDERVKDRHIQVSKNFPVAA